MHQQIFRRNHKVKKVNAHAANTKKVGKIAGGREGGREGKKKKWGKGREGGGRRGERKKVYYHTTPFLVLPSRDCGFDAKKFLATQKWKNKNKKKLKLQQKKTPLGRRHTLRDIPWGCRTPSGVDWKLFLQKNCKQAQKKLHLTNPSDIILKKKKIVLV